MKKIVFKLVNIKTIHIITTQLFMSFFIFLIFSSTAVFALSKNVSSKNLHLISITATKPFPSKISVLSTETAMFSIMNIGWTPVTVTDETIFPSGMSLSAFNCDTPLNPGETCTIALQLKAPATPQMIDMQLTEVAKPKPGIRDVVQYPINIAIVDQSAKYTITPSATVGGTILPHTPQQVAKKSSITFTAKPQTDYFIKDWSLDDVIVQQGNETYTLSNIDANHRVKVTFSKEQANAANFVALGNRADYSNPVYGYITVSQDNGNNWHLLNLTDKGLIEASCTGLTKSPLCMIAMGKSLFLSSDITKQWKEIPFNNMNINTVGCSDGGTEATCIAGITAIPEGDNGSQTSINFVITNNGGKTWRSQKVIIDNDYSGFTNDGTVMVSCSGPGKQAVCNIVGADGTVSGGERFAMTSVDAGNTWTVFPETIIGDIRILQDLSCTGENNNIVCAFVGSSDFGNPVPYLAATEAGGKKWTVINLNSDYLDLGELDTVSCTGSGATALCIAIGTGQVQEVNGNITLIALSSDGGKTWKYKNSSNIPPNTSINTISCTGSDDNTLCVAAGASDNKLPLLMMSTDKGNTWTLKEFSMGQGNFNTSACHGSGKNATCAIGGVVTIGKSNQPLMVTTNDGGSSWEIKTKGLPPSDVAISALTSMKD